LIGRKRYGLLCISVLALLFIGYYSGILETIFWDVIGPILGKDRIGLGLRGMGSGRLDIWANQLAMFSSLPVERYFLGVGIGKEILYGSGSFGGSHNDLLSLLLSLGIIGIVLYLFIILTFFVEILKSDLDRILKFTYMGFLIAVLAMDVMSNSYVTRFEMGQYFFFVMGMFYSMRDVSVEKRRDLSGHY
jgi:O-antigen ligase